MLLATLSAFASVGGVTLPGVDPPARSSEPPKLLHGVHHLRAIAAIESWQNSNVSECSALEDMVRNASGLKVGSSLVFPKNHKDLCLRTNSVYDCDKAVELVRTVKPLLEEFLAEMRSGDRLLSGSDSRWVDTLKLALEGADEVVVKVRRYHDPDHSPSHCDHEGGEPIEVQHCG